MRHRSSTPYRLIGKYFANSQPAIPYRVVDEYGVIAYKVAGKFHRTDGPAIIWPSGYQAWYQNGKYHRDDGPAYIGADGSEVWYQHGKLHRTDGPAYIYPDGTELYWLNGQPVDIMVHFLQRP